MIAAFLFLGMLALLLLGVPVAVALGLSSVGTILLFGSESLASIANKFAGAMQLSTLLAIPFFIFAGALMTTGGVARRMIAFAIDCVGHLHGGLAIAGVLACMLFAAVSGSSPATVIAVGSVIIAGMVKAGYSKDFAAGVICNAGTLGILIPPSIVMVVYGAATETSVGRLFLAGVVPGIVLGLMLMVAIYLYSRHLGLPRQPKASWAATVAAGREALWGLLLIVIILGGIYGGVFTPTEAAAVAAVYALVVALFVYRDIGLRELPKVLLDAGRVTVMLMFIIANAILFAYVLTTEQIPQSVATSVLEAGMSPWLFLLMVNIVLLLAGNVMEPSSIVLILAPIIFPIAMKLNIDPIHLGIIMVVNMEIGMITPPVGLNLFVTAGVANMSVSQVIKAAMPWLGVLVLFLVLVTYVPAISTFLPNLIFGTAIVQ